MNKYYKELYQFYDNKDTVYNPTLALYVKDILLKFHSCLYISNGISDSPALNPRYINIPFNREGDKLEASEMHGGALD
jgi:hypothetical protein